MQAEGRIRAGRNTEAVLIQRNIVPTLKHEATAKTHPRRQNNHREEGANECCYKLRNE